MNENKTKQKHRSELFRGIFMCCRNLKIIIGYIANVEQKDTYLQKSIGKTNKKKKK